MNDQHICLKTVDELRLVTPEQPIRYRIPAYQRGFRWEARQVTQLLEDIQDFAQRENPQPDEFYCLQPLVLRPNDDGIFEVVDGQQRLTTLLLILRHFNERLAIKYQLKLYALQYDTRPDLLEFLENRSEERALTNIDYFHIDQAAKTIEAWFQKRETKVEEIKLTFLNKAKVIWFELSARENSVAAFTRLNVGKIPLTNGELIRALFLRRNKAAKESFQIRIAYEWDLLEKALQNNEFWYFLTNDTNQSGNRIGFLFDLVARENGMKQDFDAYATFYHFSEKLNAKGADPEEEWLALKKTHMLLEEWFQDRRLYHLVGFLIWEDVDINELRRLATGSTKREFKEKLRAKIYSITFGSSDLAALTSEQIRDLINDKVESLLYGRDSRPIRSILLLFNLATLLQNFGSNVRFQFESFKTAMWDIEHVRSITTDRPANWKGQVEWLKHCLRYLQSTGKEQELQAEIQKFIDLPSPKESDVVFEPLYEKILRCFQEAEEGEPDHSISNLVLLDYATNRSYKNAVFAVKRHRVLSLDRDGVFVPLCTRNVFLKCYNARVDNAIFWTEDDKDGYKEAIVDTLYNFFHGGDLNE